MDGWCLGLCPSWPDTHLGQTGPVWPYWENGMEPIQTKGVNVYTFYYRNRWHTFNNIQYLQDQRVAGCQHIPDIGIIYIQCICLPSDIMNRPNHLWMNAFQVPSHHSLHNMMYIQVQQKMYGHTHGRPIYTTHTSLLGMVYMLCTNDDYRTLSVSTLSFNTGCCMSKLQLAGEFQVICIKHKRILGYRSTSFNNSGSFMEHQVIEAQLYMEERQKVPWSVPPAMPAWKSKAYDLSIFYNLQNHF
jgi:hypothetical protein